MSESPLHMSSHVDLIRQDLHQHIEEDRVPELERFFKSGPGEYAEGDQFLGLRVPAIRQVMKDHKAVICPLLVDQFMKSPKHEERLFAGFALVHLYKVAKKKNQHKEIVLHYLTHLRAGRINNWDLVDSTAYHILGDYLVDRPKDILFALALTDHLWSQRAAVVSCLSFIRKREYEVVNELCAQLLSHPHDLIHKACGWMLKESGKRDLDNLLTFLELYTPQMPRTMLRFAIEKLDPAQRQYYLSLK